MNGFSLVPPWRQSLWAALAVAVMTACGGGGGGGGGDALEPTGQDPVAKLPGAVTPAPGGTATATACDSAPGRVLDVGPGQALATPSAAARVARAGDVVRIAAGDYRGDVATWTAAGLTICGRGGRARLYADGQSAGGKAIWVVSGANTTIDSIDFFNAKVSDHNGAGIRAQHTSGDLRVVNSGFYDNQNGILSVAGPITITIEGSEFARSDTGTTAALGHNLYIGRIQRLTVRNSFFHEAVRGHNLKSRAQVSVVENSYFMDGPAGRSSYLTDFPDGGQVTLRGNLLHKGPLAENPTAVAFGAESMSVWPANTLELSHNTVVMTRSGGYFLRAPAATQSLRLTANAWAGTGSPALLTGGYALGNAVQTGNVSLQATQFPGASVLASPVFWPTAAALPALALVGVPDAAYTHDSPRPYARRAITGATRLAGALQSAP
ncbi:hypothetical protein [Hydrogenophaga sp.]|uniref:hypothetical protein n=1 Tax=Hydrogenophaga sp. TaxID=1904254 RepID=UPI00286DE153|nr:hypothetical protein [Hydrogenophaga sp.]